MLVTCINERKGDWKEYLPRICFAYNTSKQASTGFTPFYLMLRQQARIPLDVIFGKPTTELQATSQYVLNMTKSSEKAYQLARDQLGTTAERQKKQYNHRVHDKPYEVGDQVWLHSSVVPRESSKNYIVHGPVHLSYQTFI